MSYELGGEKKVKKMNVVIISPGYSPIKKQIIFHHLWEGGFFSCSPSIMKKFLKFLKKLEVNIMSESLHLPIGDRFGVLGKGSWKKFPTFFDLSKIIVTFMMFYSRFAVTFHQVNATFSWNWCVPLDSNSLGNWCPKTSRRRNIEKR